MNKAVQHMQDEKGWIELITALSGYASRKNTDTLKFVNDSHHHLLHVIFFSTEKIYGTIFYLFLVHCHLHHFIILCNVHFFIIIITIIIFGYTIIASRSSYFPLL